MGVEDGATESKSGLGSFVRNVVTGNYLSMLAAGGTAGYSIAVLGNDAVRIPVFGSAPGVLVGTVGLLVAFAVYRRASCCDDCGGKACGCTGKCGDNCSYDP